MYFIMLLFFFLKYLHFIYMVCCNLNDQLQGQRVKYDFRLSHRPIFVILNVQMPFRTELLVVL